MKFILIIRYRDQLVPRNKKHQEIKIDSLWLHVASLFHKSRGRLPHLYLKPLYGGDYKSHAPLVGLLPLRTVTQWVQVFLWKTADNTPT